MILLTFVLFMLPHLVWLHIVISPTSGSLWITVSSHREWFVTVVLFKMLRNNLQTPLITPNVAARPIAPQGGSNTVSSVACSNESMTAYEYLLLADESNNGYRAMNIRGLPKHRTVWRG